MSGDVLCHRHKYASVLLIADCKVCHAWRKGWARLDQAVHDSRQPDRQLRALRFNLKKAASRLRASDSHLAPFYTRRPGSCANIDERPVMGKPAAPSGAYGPQNGKYEKDNPVWVYTSGKWREGTIAGKDGSSGQHYKVKLQSTTTEEPFAVEDICMRA